jgi:hypothetical protein
LRFIDKGPSIPDELLLARDQGRVVFFCGAGVSRAKAGLPDFFGLAEQVIESLGVIAESPVRKVITEAKEIEARTEISGLISADKFFGLLEREFYPADIEHAVSQALKPDKPDLSAHQTMIDLATTPTGLVKLVTTNFDRLFNDSRPELSSWQPPQLPNPSRAKELDGIVYLHGRANEKYTSSEGDGFILSSAEFGRAYLSEAWATDFIKQILNKYVVVFVGYTADDPPVHYLLEALNKTDENLEKIYAFQAGTKEEARVKWQHKGVESIAYDDSYAHIALWNTLDAWAIRANDNNAWYDSVIDKAKQGPRELKPFERGQVAHVISSPEGITRILESDEELSAEWLLVFDKYCRYAKPSYLGTFTEQGPKIDPFDLYCLDSDPVPEKRPSDDHYSKREVPSEIWDGFELNHTDKTESLDFSLPYFRGFQSSKAPNLSMRLNKLHQWIGSVATSPVTLWWVMQQVELHPSVIDGIKWKVDRGDLAKYPTVQQGWRYYFEAHNEKVLDHDANWYQLKDLINKDGWSHQVLRQYNEYLRPRLAVEKGYGFAPILAKEEDINNYEILRRDIHYPNPADDIAVPSNWLPLVVEGIRKNLEIALHLESDIGYYNLSNVGSLTPENNEGDYDLDNNVSSLLMRMSAMFEILVDFDVTAAKREFNTWRTDDSHLFSLLIIWAARKPLIVSDEMFANLFLDNLSSDAFWSSNHSRDLLLTLQARWSNLTIHFRNAIEDRIITGPDKWNDEDDDKFIERKAWSTLNRLHWLNNNGCSLLSDINNITENLKPLVPRWTEKAIPYEIKENITRGGMVRTEKNYSKLSDLPLEQILTKSEELRGRTDDFLIEAEPFAGLVEDYPIKSFKCLHLASESGTFYEWAWRIFLNHNKRKDDNPKFIALIAERLSRYSSNNITPLVRDIGYWFKAVSGVLSTRFPSSYRSILTKLTDLVAVYPDCFQTSLIRSNTRKDSVMEAINSPVASVIEGMFKESWVDETKEGIPREWLENIEKFTAEGGDLYRYALVICNRNLGWFYAREEKWTEKYLLSAISSDDEETIQAFWSGFFGSGKVPGPELFRVLKKPMLKFAHQNELGQEGYGKVMVSNVLAGWTSTDEETNSPYISNKELRELLVRTDDDFRSQVLWRIKFLCSKDEDGSWLERLIVLLQDVWPKQISAKSPSTTKKLCDLAFTNEKIFAKVSHLIQPLLVKVNNEHNSIPHLGRRNEKIIENHPEKVLSILHVVLSNDSRRWPYHVNDVFIGIEQADPNLRYDERLIELKRKWNSR